MNVWLWLPVLVLPVGQMAWSMWETTWSLWGAISDPVAGNIAVGESPHGIGIDTAYAIAVQTFAHGVGIALVMAVVLHVVVTRTSDGMPRRVKLEPTVRPPA